SSGGVLAHAGIPGKVLFQRGATDITTGQHDGVVVSAAKWASEGLRHNFEIKKSNGESEVLGFLGESVSGQTGAFVALLDLYAKRLGASSIGSGLAQHGILGEDFAIHLGHQIIFSVGVVVPYLTELN